MTTKTEVSPLLADILVGLSDGAPSRKLFNTDKQITYGQLKEDVAKTRGLFRGLSIEIGYRVVIATEDKYCCSVLYFACLLEGITAIPLDPHGSPSEILGLVLRVRCHGCFFDKSIKENVLTLSTEKPDYPIVAIQEGESKKRPFSLLIRARKKTSPDNQHYPNMLSAQQPVWQSKCVPPATPAIILFTSGTTSRPKGVVLSQESLCQQLIVLKKQFALTSDCKIVNHLPLHHSDGIHQGPLLALSVGCSWAAPLVGSVQSLGALMDTIYQERATHLITVPTILSMMTMLPESYNDTFSSPEFCFIESTAGPLKDELWCKIEQRFHTCIVNCFGLTETVNEVFYSGPDDASRKIGTIGKPLNCDVQLVAEDGVVLVEGVSGELWLKSNQIMQQYWDDPEETARCFSGDWFKTGDIAVKVEGGYYKISGRKKSVIIRGGINIQPEEVTEILLSEPTVEHCITFGVEDPVFGEKVVSCVTVKGSTQASSDKLFHFCRERLSQEKCPNDILIMAQLPFGPSGKVDTPKLKALLDNERHERMVAAGHQNKSNEEKLFAIAATAFKLPVAELSSASQPDNTSGWDSLAFLELVIAVEKGFQVKLTPLHIMNIQSLGDFLALVEK